MSRTVVVVRALTLLSALGLLGRWAGADLANAADALRDPQRLIDTRGADQLVLGLLQLALTALCSWCALCVLLVSATSLGTSPPLTRVAVRLTPRGARRLVAAALGVSALSLTACGAAGPDSRAAAPTATPPAYAASSDPFDWPAAASPTTSPSTAAPATPAPPAAGGSTAPSGAPPPAGSASTSGAVHVVLPGECLWDIARTALGPSAGVAQVAHLVDDLYAANQLVIGPDPDLLPVGATLTLPPAG